MIREKEKEEDLSLSEGTLQYVYKKINFKSLKTTVTSHSIEPLKVTERKSRLQLQKEAKEVVFRFSFLLSILLCASQMLSLPT